jgi:beta-lactamase class A
MARRRLSVALLATGVLSGALLVSPPASTASATRTSPQRGYPWKRRVAAARHFAQHRIGTVSFAIVGEHRNLRGYKPRREFHSASVVKVMLMLSYLRRPSVRNRPLNAHDKSLLHPMITRSDNTTATEIYDIVGNAGLNRLARAAHMRDFHPNVVWGLTLIAARDMSEFMYRIRRYIPERHRRYALHLLSHIVSYQRWGVPPAKPPGWRVYFKGGFIPAADGWRINQVALLRRGSRKLALAILTQGNPTLQYGAKTVQGVTTRLLRNYNQLVPGHRLQRVAGSG